jgi:hypothetical protein
VSLFVKRFSPAVPAPAESGWEARVVNRAASAVAGNGAGCFVPRRCVRGGQGMDQLELEALIKYTLSRLPVRNREPGSPTDFLFLREETFHGRPRSRAAQWARMRGETRPRARSMGGVEGRCGPRGCGSKTGRGSLHAHRPSFLIDALVSATPSSRDASARNWTISGSLWWGVRGG